jgi:hypothetical protein
VADYLSVISVAAIAAVNLIGLGVLVRWLVVQINALKGTVDALKGTVAAQEQTIKTIGTVNQAVLEVFKATDPERWAKEITIHKRLADDKAQAIVEQARAEFDRSQAARDQNIKEALAYQAGVTEDYIRIVMTLLPYVAKPLRVAVLDSIQVRQSWTTSTLKHYAEQLPESQPQLTALWALFANAAFLEKQELKELKPPDVTRSSMLRPPAPASFVAGYAVT